MSLLDELFEGRNEARERGDVPDIEPSQVVEMWNTRNVGDLAMLVKQLVHALRKAAPDHDLPARASDYLKRHGLSGTPLRTP